mmetsp:Transcript_115675/g.373738  ORF Transcript_115675/g.373738 Transcript_115675/m.373738 type:complete len:235 (-) Transcript_115675:381-1085(-)
MLKCVGWPRPRPALSLMAPDERGLLFDDVEELSPLLQLRLRERFPGERGPPSGKVGGLAQVLHVKPCASQQIDVAVDWSLHSTPAWHSTSLVLEPMLPLSLWSGAPNSGGSLIRVFVERDPDARAPDLMIVGSETCRTLVTAESSEKQVLVVSLNVARVARSSSLPCACIPLAVIAPVWVRCLRCRLLETATAIVHESSESTDTSPSSQETFRLKGPCSPGSQGPTEGKSGMPL